MKEQVATAADLKALNRFALKELREDDVFIFSAKFIDSEPTANGRIWSREWMEKAIELKLFEGIPFLTNHENDQGQKIGTVFSAELREDGIHGQVFIPLDEQGKKSKESIQNGRIRNVSINADGEIKQEKDITRILPSDDMRVFEVSAVAVPGCKKCVINEKSPSGTCETKQETMMNKFAQEQLAELQDEFIRLAGFSLGTGIDREVYRKVAELLDPMTLKTLAKDFRQFYENSQKNDSQKAIKVDDSNGSIDQIRKSLEHINKIKGV